MTDPMTYTVREAAFASGLKLPEFKRWYFKGRFAIPAAHPGTTKSQRYGRANIFEAALFGALLRTGVPGRFASFILKARWTYMLKVRAKELLRPEPHSLDVLNTDFDQWAGFEFTDRDDDDPIMYVVRPGDRGGFTLACPHARSVGEVFTIDGRRGRVAFVIVNASRICEAVDSNIETLDDAVSSLQRAKGMNAMPTAAQVQAEEAQARADGILAARDVELREMLKEPAGG